MLIYRKMVLGLRGLWNFVKLWIYRLYIGSGMFPGLDISLYRCCCGLEERSGLEVGYSR